MGGEGKVEKTNLEKVTERLSIKVPPNSPYARVRIGAAGSSPFLPLLQMSVHDFYSLLGVSRDATPTQIRRAYKDHCLLVHPDRQPEGPQRTAAESTFKQLSSAYQTLSDPNKRAIHDAQLATNDGAGASIDLFHDEDFKRQFAKEFESKMREEGSAPLDGQELFDALFGEKRKAFKFEPEREKGKDVQLIVPVSLEDMHTGCAKRRRVTRLRRDEKTGKLRPVKTIMRVDVKPGYRPGDKIRFCDAGNETEEMKAPDLVFILEQESHDRFTRNGDDLLCDMQVSLVDALTGVENSVQGIDGEAIDVKVEDIIKPGDTHVLKGKGMNRRGNASRGDLIINFQIQFPTRLLPGEKKSIRELFTKIEENEATSPMRRSVSMFLGAAYSREFHETDETSVTSPNLKRSPSRAHRKNSTVDTISESQSTTTSGRSRARRRSKGWRRAFF